MCNYYQDFLLWGLSWISFLHVIYGAKIWSFMHLLLKIIKECMLKLVWFTSHKKKKKCYFLRAIQSLTKICHIKICHLWMQILSCITHPDLPTSTFLPYFVRFLKGNTAVRFFLQKYVFQNFLLFFFFFFFSPPGELKFYITHIIYENLVRVFE